MTVRRTTFPATVHLFLIRDGRVLLLRRFNTGYRDGSYSVVAGHLDGGEPILDATVREAREEVGIAVEPQDLTVVGVMHRREGEERIDFFLTTDTWRGAIVNAEPEKCDEVAWFPLDGLPDNVVPYVARAIENFRRGIWFESYGWEDEGDAADAASTGR